MARPYWRRVVAFGHSSRFELVEKLGEGCTGGDEGLRPRDDAVGRLIARGGANPSRWVELHAAPYGDRRELDPASEGEP